MNKGNSFQQGLGMAFRVGVEMTVATVIGALMGFALDKYFETRPWLLMVGVLLGGAAGCLNVYRAVSSMPAEEDDADDENHHDDGKGS